jgi:hypothetical protein
MLVVRRCCACRLSLSKTRAAFSTDCRFQISNNQELAFPAHFRLALYPGAELALESAGVSAFRGALQKWVQYLPQLELKDSVRLRYDSVCQAVPAALTGNQSPAPRAATGCAPGRVLLNAHVPPANQRM